MRLASASRASMRSTAPMCPGCRSPGPIAPLSWARGWRAGKLTFEATPVLAFGRLYLETGTNIVIALDPESGAVRWRFDARSEEHTSELQSHSDLVCRLLLEKKKTTQIIPKLMTTPRTHVNDKNRLSRR